MSKGSCLVASETTVNTTSKYHVIFFSECSCHKRKHLVLSDHGDEHGERDVSELPAPVPGLVRLVLGKVKLIYHFIPHLNLFFKDKMACFFGIHHLANIS